MAELTVSQIIKLIIGALVIVAVVVGAYFIFKKDVFTFFKSLPTNGTTGIKLILSNII